MKNWLIHDHLLLPQYVLNQTIKAGLTCPQRPVSLQRSNLFLGQTAPTSNRTWFWANPRRRQAGTLSPAANWSRAPQLSWSSPFVWLQEMHDGNISSQMARLTRPRTHGRHKSLALTQRRVQITTKPAAAGETTQVITGIRGVWRAAWWNKPKLRFNSNILSNNVLSQGKDLYYHISSNTNSCSCAALLQSYKPSKRIHPDHMSPDMMHNSSPLPPSQLAEPHTWLGWRACAPTGETSRYGKWEARWRIIKVRGCRTNAPIKHKGSHITCLNTDRTDFKVPRC